VRHESVTEDHGNDADFGNPPMLRTLPTGRGILVVGPGSRRQGVVATPNVVRWAAGGAIWGWGECNNTAHFGIPDWGSGQARGRGRPTDRTPHRWKEPLGSSSRKACVRLNMAAARHSLRP